MCWDFSETTQQKARKDYHCDAADWIREAWPYEDYFSAEEVAIIEKAEAEGWKILKGTTYEKTRGKYDGRFSTFRARPELNKICNAHGIYDDC